MTAKHWFTNPDLNVCVPAAGGGRAPRWRIPRTLTLLIAAMAMLGADLARGQAPVVQDRVPAASDPNNAWVTEPAIAVGPDVAITVFFDGLYVGRYGICDVATGEWDEGVIPMGDFFSIGDLSIAYEAQTGDFMAVALGTVEHFPWNQRYLVTSRWQSATGFETWEAQDGPYGVTGMDKPWIVAGDPNGPSGQEYYIVYWRGIGASGKKYRYLRSVDSGAHWAADDIRAPDPNDPNDPNGFPVPGYFCAQPAVCGDGPLYVAYMLLGGDEIRFLVGEDVDGDPNDPNYDPNDPAYVGVTFDWLYGMWTPLGGPLPPIRVPIRVALNSAACEEHLPGDDEFECKRVPYLVADPTSPNRLYILYHDTASDDPNDAGYHDVNVYLQKLTKFGSHWVLGPRKQVNNDDTEYESDQFMPSAVVDDAGYIHVIFYDDRNYTDDPNDPKDQQPDGCLHPKFDVFYAYSMDHGEYWYNHELRAPEGYEEPAIDFQHPAAELREYIGIAWYGDEETSQVWTAFNGTSQYEERNKALIWSSLIEW